MFHLIFQPQQEHRAAAADISDQRLKPPENGYAMMGSHVRSFKTRVD